MFIQPVKTLAACNEKSTFSNVFVPVIRWHSYLFSKLLNVDSYGFTGVKFNCSNCGKEGHRRNYCPEVEHELRDRRFRCRLCGEKGHNRRTCQRSQSHEKKTRIRSNHHCKICGQTGHNRRTCPQLAESESTTAVHPLQVKDMGTIALVSPESCRNLSTQKNDKHKHSLPLLWVKSRNR